MAKRRKGPSALHVTGPEAARVALGGRLRELREASGVTFEECELLGFGSARTIGRREDGIPPYNPTIVRQMCVRFGASAEETNELVAVVHAIKSERLFEDSSDLMPRDFGLYREFEAKADGFLMHHPEVVPGLLQTAAYAVALAEALRPALSEQRIRHLVDARMARQRTVFAPDRTVNMRVVLGEGVLARKVGGPEVAAAQLEHLHWLIEHRGVSLSVLPFEVGAHAAMNGSFILLRGKSTVVYVETPGGGELLHKGNQVSEREEVFRAIEDPSIPLGEYVKWRS